MKYGKVGRNAARGLKCAVHSAARGGAPGRGDFDKQRTRGRQGHLSSGVNRRYGYKSDRDFSMREKFPKRQYEASSVQKMILSAGTIGDLLGVTTTNLEYLDRLNVVAAYRRMAEITSNRENSEKDKTSGNKQGRTNKMPMRNHDNEQWKTVQRAAQICAESDTLSPYEIASIVASMRTSGPRPDGRLLLALQESAFRKINYFKAKNIAHMLLGLVQLRVVPLAKLIRAIDDKLRKDMKDCPAHVAANILWALRKLNVSPSSDLVYGLVKRVLDDRGDTVRVKLLARTLWAYASFKDNQDGHVVPMEGNIDLLDQEASSFSESEEDDSTSQNLEDARASQAKILEALVDKLLQRMENGEKDHIAPGDVAHAIWAFAKISLKDEKINAIMKRNIEDNIERFDGYDTTNIIWSLGKLNCEAPNSRLVASLEQRVVAQGQNLLPQGFSNTLWAFATLQHIPGDSFVELAEQYVTHRANAFDAQSIGNTLWAYAKLTMRITGGERDALMAGLYRVSDQFVPQELSITLWSFAHLELQVMQDVWDAVESPLINKVPLMAAQGVANTVWAFASLVFQPSDAVRESLLVETRRKLHDFTPQALSNLVWSFGRLDWTEEVQVLVSTSMNHLYEFNTLEATNFLWGLAKCRYCMPRENWTDIEISIIQRLGEFSDQGLVVCLWAIARLQDRFSEHFADCLADEMLMRDLNQFTSQSISNALWAFAKMQLDPSQDMFDRVQDAITTRLSSFKAQEIANSFWAFAKLMKEPRGGVLIGLQMQAESCMEDLTSQGISNILWAFGRLTYIMVDKPFMDVVQARASSIASTFTPQEISNTIWAFGQMRLQPTKRMLQLLLQSGSSQMESWKPEEISGMLCGLVKLNRSPELDFTNRLQRQALRTADHFSNEGKSIVLWALETLQVEVQYPMQQAFCVDDELVGDVEVIEGNKITLEEEPSKNIQRDEE